MHTVVVGIEIKIVITWSTVKSLFVSMFMYVHICVKFYAEITIYIRTYIALYMINNYIVLFTYIYVAPTPRTFLKPNYLRGIIGETRELVCLIALSSTESTSVNLTWNFSSNDSRVTVIPTTITTDDSIGIIYTTVIQFAYLTEEDERNYTCNLTIENAIEESIFDLEIISKLNIKA